MKKITLFIAMLVCFQSFGQMTKVEIETAINGMPDAKIEKLYLDNRRTFYTDGTSQIVQSMFTFNKVKLEPGVNSIIMYYYTDETKSEISSINVFPYASIESFVVTETWMKIVFIGR